MVVYKTMLDKIFEFLSFYKLSFEGRNIDNLLSCYEYPCVIRHENKNRLFSRADFEANLINLLSIYSSKNFKHAYFKILDFQQLTSNEFQVSVYWKLADSFKNIFSSFNCLYQITINEKMTPVIFNLINFNENFESNE